MTSSDDYKFFDDITSSTALSVDDALRVFDDDMPVAAATPSSIPLVPARELGAPATQSARTNTAVDEYGFELLDEECRSNAASPTKLLLGALAEYEQTTGTGAYVRVIELESQRYLIVGTWRGEYRGASATVFGSLGGESSFVKSPQVIADSTNDSRTHRVWLFKHRVGMPLRIWFNTGGSDRVTKHMLLDDSDAGYRDVDKLTYEQARRTWNSLLGCI